MIQTIDTPVTTNDMSLDRVIKAGLPVTLIFYNTEIPASLEQAMKALAKEYAGLILIVKINTKDNPRSAQQYQIHASPTLVTFIKGSSADQVSNITDIILEAHVKYLLGLGPKPPAPTHDQTVSTQKPQEAGTNHTINKHPINVTDATFDKVVLGSSIPVLVDFWAPWCGPCRMIEPIMDKFAKEMSGKLRLAKVNVDENPNLSQRYGIYSIPTMMIVKNGIVIDQWSGALPESAIRNRLELIKPSA
jgi:thioredoxin